MCGDDGELSFYLSVCACLPAGRMQLQRTRDPNVICLGRASLINIWRAINSWVIAHFYKLMFCKYEKTNKTTEQGDNAQRQKEYQFRKFSTKNNSYTKHIHKATKLWRPSNCKSHVTELQSHCKFNFEQNMYSRNIHRKVVLSHTKKDIGLH